MIRTEGKDVLQTSARARAVGIGGVVPALIGLVSTILMFTWLPQLPDPIAVHWSGAGPDGYGSAAVFALAPGIITVLFSVFAVGFSWKTSGSGRISWTQKFVLVMSVWLAVFLSFTFVASVAIQRGLADARTAPDVAGWLGLGAITALVLTVVAWWILPHGETIEAPGNRIAPLDVRGNERVSWSHTARFGSVALAFVGFGILVAMSAVVVTGLSRPTSMIVAVIVLAVVLLLVLTNVWWRVSADRRGFIVRSALGWPRKHIGLDDIRSVSVVDVHPSRDFGGWGWRLTGGGRSGVILRAGIGIEVTQGSGKRFTVTVDDAETGAAVLAALLKQGARR